MPKNLVFQTASCSTPSIDSLAKKFQEVTKAFPIDNINAANQLSMTVNYCST